jgi:hypothetical protein
VVYFHLTEDLKLLLIDRLKSKGIDPALIPAFLKALTSLISSEPRLEVESEQDKDEGDSD